jgi:ABC-type lipoprotein release transport system permease subunit
MKSLSFHLAWRYLTHTHNNASIKHMIRMCFIGIMIGTCALMLTLIITNGFEAVISEKIRGINAPITISSPGRRLD